MLDQCQALLDSVAGGSGSEDEAALAELFPPLDATALYRTVCKLNHSCDPNCKVVFETAAAAAKLVTLREVAAGEELTISYCDASAAEPERAAALRNYHFRCGCQRCVAERGAAPAGLSGDSAMPSELPQPRPMDLTEESLTIQLCQEDVGPGGGLSSQAAARAAQLLETAGVVALRPGGTAVAGADLLSRCREAALSSCDQLEGVLAARASEGSIDMATQKPFRFREISWRGVGRYDVKCDTASLPWSDGSLCDLPFLAPLLRRCLGRGYRMLFMGVVVARPGATDQGLHADGGHLFRLGQPDADSAGGDDEEAETEGTYAPLLPAHCLNVFLPLVDLTEELGPTQFYPGSHALGTVISYPEGGR